MNIIWKRSDGSIATTHLVVDSISPQVHADELKAKGDIPADYEAVAFDYTGIFPTGKMEGWAWDGSSIIEDPIRSAQVFNADINAQIAEIERANVLPRPIRDILLKDPSSPSFNKIQEIDSQIAKLRGAKK